MTMRKKRKLTLTMTRGIPASGKTTWAEQEVINAKACGEKVVIVNKDDIRAELVKQGWKWSHETEKEVIEIRNKAIVGALAHGESVICSDCNFGKHKQRLSDLARKYGAEFRVVDFTHVPLETCIERDSKRPEGKRVGEKVIREMYEKYVAIPKVEHYVPKSETPLAIICDLDGTLALFDGKRSPYDAAKCADDDLNLPVYEVISAMCNRRYKIIYLSGREDKFRAQTEAFLTKHLCPVGGPLLMRPTGDFRKDYIVKQELFDKYVRNDYNVLFVLDDRNSVVKMWRELGLTCLQVAEGAF